MKRREDDRRERGEYRHASLEFITVGLAAGSRGVTLDRRIGAYTSPRVAYV